VITNSMSEISPEVDPGYSAQRASREIQPNADECSNAQQGKPRMPIFPQPSLLSCNQAAQLANGLRGTVTFRM
jgi:hypothetical protein